MKIVAVKFFTRRVLRYSLIASFVLANLFVDSEFARADGSKATSAVGNVIKWATASEVDNFGYDVYRGIRKQGPFEKITSQPVAGAGTVDTPQYYRFVDTNIGLGIAYYYYVESISISGVRERFTPVYRAEPKAKLTD